MLYDAKQNIHTAQRLVQEAIGLVERMEETEEISEVNQRLNDADSQLTDADDNLDGCHDEEDCDHDSCWSSDDYYAMESERDARESERESLHDFLTSELGVPDAEADDIQDYDVSVGYGLAPSTLAAIMLRCVEHLHTQYVDCEAERDAVCEAIDGLIGKMNAKLAEMGGQEVMSLEAQPMARNVSTSIVEQVDQTPVSTLPDGTESIW